VQDGGVAKDVNIVSSFIVVIYVVLRNMLCEVTTFVVACIVPLWRAVNIFRIYFHWHVRVRYLPFGCVVRSRRWVHACFE
jgi:hypothetical protein